MHRCIRLKLYSSQQDEHYGSEEAVVDDVVDFPLGPNGDLDFERIKLWWGVKICAVRYFEEKSSSVSCRGITLIDGNMTNKHRLLCWPLVPVTDRR